MVVLAQRAGMAVLAQLAVLVPVAVLVIPMTLAVGRVTTTAMVMAMGTADVEPPRPHTRADGVAVTVVRPSSSPRCPLRASSDVSARGGTTQRTHTH